MKKNLFIKQLIFLASAVFVISCTNQASKGVKKNSGVERSKDDYEVVVLRNTPKKVDLANRQDVTLIEAAQAIVYYHPRVKQAIATEKAEEELIAVAKSQYYPQIRGGIGMRRDSNRSSRYDKEFLQDINIEIEQILYDFGKRASAVKIAEYGYLTAKAYTAMTNEELAHMASIAVVSTARYDQLKRLAKNQVATVSALGKLVEERHDKGASNLSDVYQAKSRLDDVLSEELDTTSQYESIVRILGLIIGQPHIKNAIVGNLPESLGLSCYSDPSWSSIPSYQVAEYDAGRAVAELLKAQADELPTISVRGNLSRPLNATPQYGSKIDSTVSLNLSMPMYQGGGLSASKRAAVNRAESADVKKAEVMLDVNQKMSETRVNLENLYKRKNLLAQRVSNQRNTKELYRKQYLELGTRTLLDLLNAEREYHQAQTDVVNNQFDIIQAQLDCAFYQGKIKDVLNINTY